MAGTLLNVLYRQLFRTFVDDMMKQLKKDIDNPRTNDINMLKAMRHDSITKGLRSALATGNWGKDKQGNVQKTGVS